MSHFNNYIFSCTMEYQTYFSFKVQNKGIDLDKLRQYYTIYKHKEYSMIYGPNIDKTL